MAISSLAWRRRSDSHSCFLGLEEVVMAERHVPSFDPCPPEEERTDCPLYPGCFEDYDHIYGPARQYRTSLERQFRSDPGNIVIRCRNKHNLRHATEDFPPKPTATEMQRFIGALGIGDLE